MFEAFTSTNINVLVITAVVAGIIGATIQFVVANYLWPNRHKVYTWWFALRNHKKLGEPCPTDIVLKRQGYALGYSKDKKCALWVSYIISKGSIGADVAEREDDFYPDPEIPEECRVKPEDFRNTGYDKGHLAPSAAIDFSHKSNQETFAMSNIALQHPKLNRQAWGSLENYARNWAYSKGKLCIIAGPLYDSKQELVNNIPLPKAFYKVVYSFKYKKSIGFILPNNAVNASQLWEHAVPVKEIEKATGYRFFERLGDKAKPIKSTVDAEWWKN